MILTEEQGRKVIEKLNESMNGKLMECPLCHNNTWQVDNLVVEFREFNNGNLILGGNSAIIPAIPLTCRKCGSMHFINALKLGIIQPNKQENGER